jgi:outer membrane protein OmpA-like peptidoglycan-associated protein
VVVLACAGGVAAAPDQYTGPDDPRTEAAARAALPAAKIVAINGKVIAIELRVSGIEGLIQDLNARVTAQEILIDLPGDVLFDFDKWTLRREAEATLAKVAALINAHPRALVSIEGHTDAKGDAAYNQRLSEQRAAAVRDWLVAHGVNGANLSTRGWGKARPVAPNTRPDGGDDPEGRQKNRRVEIRIRK